MGKAIKGTYGDFNERVMLAMYAVTCQHNMDSGQLHFVRGRGVSHILGGSWSTYRHRLMLQLQGQGGIVCLKIKRGRESWHYALTKKGYNTVFSLIQEGNRGAFNMPAKKAIDAAESQKSLFELVGN